MAFIKNIYAQEILDSRGYPTLLTSVILSDSSLGKSSVPSGTSVGHHEAVEFRDGDSNRYEGRGVLKAVELINKRIGPQLIGVDASDQKKVDRMLIQLDATPNKSKLGANVTLSISQAVARTAATSYKLPLFMYIRHFTSKQDSGYKIPAPIFGILEGGKHGSSSLNFQEFTVIPALSKSFQEALIIGTTIYHSCMKLMHDKGYSQLVSEEGGFAPDIPTNKDALAFLKQAIEASSAKYSLDVFLGLAASANSFFIKSSYKLIDRIAPYSSDDLVAYYTDLFNEYSLVYLEDPIAEDDINGWKKIYASLSDKTMIVGDDFVATNPYRLQVAIENNTINAVIVKPNQIGTITETLAFCEIARYKNLKIIVSDRSAETSDDFIADFAVGVGADYIKFGAPARERISKYNRLLEIEEETARYKKQKENPEELSNM